MSVGTNIKNRRREIKMTQQELADAMGYKSRSTIAKIESGENDISQKKLQRFAVVLDTSVETLVSGDTALMDSCDYGFVPHDFKVNKTAVVILAGGTNDGYRPNVPNQFINVHGKPIIVYCMDAYQNHPSVDDIYVVSPKGWENIIKAYARQYGITKLKELIPAGSSGTASLKNAVDRIKGKYEADDILIIQEATRPMVTPETISRLLQESSEAGSATICHRMNDYVQFSIDAENPRYVNRDSIIAVQSPEAHKFSLITEVFERTREREYRLVDSCCTMLLYNLGYDINFIEGSTNNIKISREEDIAAFSAKVKHLFQDVR